jgi:alkanesulfonate monooxygenase SsuD/methylene tetrahydromethanopterin reductase-like flavin-dependent oxidoreductase (luciferase family)
MTKLGYLVPTREQIMQGSHGTRELLQRAKFAKDAGFDSLWVGDSLFARPRHDPLTLLAALAIETPGMELGTAILLQSLRNPIILAQQLATIDQLAEGKLIVGVGIGADAPSIRAEFSAAGVPFEKRVGRLVESVNLCRALWRGEPVTWNGRWQVEDALVAPTPFQEGGPRIWYAAGVDAGVERAGKHFDGWFPIGPDAATIARQQQILNGAAAVSGRHVSTAVYLTICVDDSIETADQKINDYLEQYYGFSAEILRGIQACCGGDAESVLAWMNEFVDAGAEHLVIRIVGDYQKALGEIARLRHLLK